MTKLLYYLHYSCMSDNNVFQVVVVDLETVYVYQAKQEKGIGMNDVKLYLAYRAIDFNGFDRGGHTNVKLYIDLFFG